MTAFKCYTLDVSSKPVYRTVPLHKNVDISVFEI